MTYWKKRAPARENLRMFERPDIWRRYADETDGEQAVAEPGCAEKLESALINCLNATNVLLLTGAGSSYSASNDEASSAIQKTAPALTDLWDAVKAKVGAAAFDTVNGTIPNGAVIENIEKLLTQCKLFVALYGAGDGKMIDDFIGKAETAILERKFHKRSYCARRA
jgi:hypothetical protein